MCVYIYIYIYMHLYVYVNGYEQNSPFRPYRLVVLRLYCTDTYMYICIDIYTYVTICSDVHTYISIYTYTCRYRVHTHLFKRVYVYACVGMRVRLSAFVYKIT